MLEQNGWELARIQGSHHIYRKLGSTVRLSVPIHGNQPLKKGLLHHLLKAAWPGDNNSVNNDANYAQPKPAQ